MGHFNITIKHQSLTAAIHCYSNCRYLLFNVFFNLFFQMRIGFGMEKQCPGRSTQRQRFEAAQCHGEPQVTIKKG